MLVAYRQHREQRDAGELPNASCLQTTQRTTRCEFLAVLKTKNACCLQTTQRPTRCKFFQTGHRATKYEMLADNTENSEMVVLYRTETYKMPVAYRHREQRYARSRQDREQQNTSC